MYDVIVLGATFTAAGIAHQYKKKCLVIERRVQAGHEFFGALHFGSNYTTKMEEPAALSLQQHFLQNQAGVYGCDAHIYPFFQEATVRFGTEVVSVEQTDQGFLCTTHGVDGFCTFQTRKIIDTRSHAERSTEKSFNLLIESKETPSFSGVRCEKTGMDGHYVLCCPVPLSFGYAEARTAALKLVMQFSEAQRVILLAHEFDYSFREAGPDLREGIWYLPSKAYENPILAFEAGLKFGKEAAQ